jgi:hypothetical protein
LNSGRHIGQHCELIQRAKLASFRENRPSKISTHQPEEAWRPKAALGAWAPMAIPQDVNQRWSLDFISDSWTDGRRFRIPCIIDDFNRRAWPNDEAGSCQRS